MPLKLTGYIEVPPEDLEVVLAHLPAHIRLTRAEQGCLAFTVKQRVIKEPDGAPLVFDVEEIFIDRAAFEAHQARTAASLWGRVTANFARHYQLSEG